MRLLLIALLLAACTPAAAAPAPTEDPRIATLTAERNDLQRQVQTLTDQVVELKAKAAESPTFVMWDIQQTIHGGRFIAAGLPDTFTATIEFVASTPVRTRIMTFPQYAAWKNGSPVDALTYPATTYLDETFHGAEGCAGYLVVLDAEKDTVITPNFTITHVIGSPATGACAN